MQDLERISTLRSSSSSTSTPVKDRKETEGCDDRKETEGHITTTSRIRTKKPSSLLSSYGGNVNEKIDAVGSPRSPRKVSELVEILEFKQCEEIVSQISTLIERTKSGVKAIIQEVGECRRRPGVVAAGEERISPSVSSEKSSPREDLAHVCMPRMRSETDIDTITALELELEASGRETDRVRKDVTEAHAKIEALKSLIRDMTVDPHTAAPAAAGEDAGRSDSSLVADALIRVSEAKMGAKEMRERMHVMEEQKKMEISSCNEVLAHYAEKKMEIFSCNEVLTDYYMDEANAETIHAECVENQNVIASLKDMIKSFEADTESIKLESKTMFANVESQLDEAREALITTSNAHATELREALQEAEAAEKIKLNLQEKEFLKEQDELKRNLEIMELNETNQLRERLLFRKKVNILQGERLNLENDLLKRQTVKQRGYRRQLGKISKECSRHANTYEKSLIGTEKRLAEEEMQCGDFKMELVLERRAKTEFEMDAMRLENQVAYAEDFAQTGLRLMETKYEEERKAMNEQKEEFQWMRGMMSELTERNTELSEQNQELRECNHRLEDNKNDLETVIYPRRKKAQNSVLPMESDTDLPTRSGVDETAVTRSSQRRDTKKSQKMEQLHINFRRLTNSNRAENGVRQWKF